MNKNVVIVLVGGFLVAILVAVLVQASLGGKKKTETIERTQVLVAAKDLTLGTELSSGDMRWQTWQGQTFSGAIIRKDDQLPEDALQGRLSQRVAAGQPMLDNFILREGRGNIVAASLGRGMRAVAIPVKADTMAGGFIGPGDYVDVILTYRIRSSRDNTDARFLVNELVSETILKKVKILAVDQDARGQSDSAKIARTVTLEVDTVGAEKVALSSEMGDLTLSLRGIGDDEIESTSDATTDIQTSNIMRSVIMMEGGGASGTVKIYSGDDLLEQRPRQGGVVAVQGNAVSGNDADRSAEGMIE